IAALGFVVAVFFGLVACGGDDSPESSDSQASEETQSEPQDEDTDSSDSSDSGDTSGEVGESPDWAADVTTPGEKLTTIELEDVTVDVYQVGVTQASEPGRYKDKETDELII